jgi:hypothetical protein
MWIKLGQEYLNLDQIIRIRFSKAFRAGQEEWAAELETLINGEIHTFTRYRGAEAIALHAALTPGAEPTDGRGPTVASAPAVLDPRATHHG